MAIDTVLFDLDSTLCRHSRSPDAMLTEAFDRAGIEPYCTASDLGSVANEVQTAESDIEFYTNCLEAVAERSGIAVDATAVARAYDATIDHSNVELIPGAAAVLDDLEGEYALGLVTNGGRYTQRQKLDALDIEDAFDALVFATPEKGVKPDSYPFERALTALDGSPDSTIHVGDSLHADVAGANAMGIESAWIRGNEEFESGIEPDHRLDSLTDLLALL
jgi:HAD superfamily hydrolase (TIGR01549 family)